MRDSGVWFKSFAIGLEMMAKGIHSIAQTMYDMANSQKPESKERAETTEPDIEKSTTKKANKADDDIAKTKTPEKPEKVESTQKKGTKRSSKKAAKKTVGTVKPKTPEKPKIAKKVVQKTSKPTPKKVTKKIKPTKKVPVPATEMVFKVLMQYGKNVDNATIIRETDLDRNQVTNALSQLKKTGKVKSVKRGVHKIA